MCLVIDYSQIVKGGRRSAVEVAGKRSTHVKNGRLVVMMSLEPQSMFLDLGQVCVTVKLLYMTKERVRVIG